VKETPAFQGKLAAFSPHVKNNPPFFRESGRKCWVGLDQMAYSLHTHSSESLTGPLQHWCCIVRVKTRDFSFALLDSPAAFAWHHRGKRDSSPESNQITLNKQWRHLGRAQEGMRLVIRQFCGICLRNCSHTLLSCYVFEHLSSCRGVSRRALAGKPPCVPCYVNLVMYLNTYELE